MVELLLDNLRLRCIIGVYPRERRWKQPLQLQLVLECDDSAILYSDDVLDGVDYAAVAAVARKAASEGRFRTLEALCWACSGQVLSAFPAVQALTIAARKPRALPGTAIAGVRLRRSRSQ